MYLWLTVTRVSSVTFVVWNAVDWIVAIVNYTLSALLEHTAHSIDLYNQNVGSITTMFNRGC